jgi:hypothetical protein
MWAPLHVHKRDAGCCSWQDSDQLLGQRLLVSNTMSIPCPTLDLFRPYASCELAMYRLASSLTIWLHNHKEAMHPDWPEQLTSRLIRLGD